MTNSAQSQFHNPAALSTPVGYTHVVEARGARTIYISGQVAMNSAGELVGPGDFRAQIEQVFRNLEAALAAAGADFNAVVKFGFYFLDASNVEILREVRDRYINREHPPASTALQVAGFVREGWLVEVDAIAVLED